MQHSLQQRVLMKAVEILGSERALAAELRISAHDLSMFLSGAECPTKAVFLAACDILIEQGHDDFLKGVAALPVADKKADAARH